MKRCLWFLLLAAILTAAPGRSLAQYGPNLLTNPGAESDFTGWTRTDGGSGWATGWQTPRTGSKCWSSSYQWGTLQQTVDLVGAGYPAVWLDQAPDVLIGCYVSTRFDHQGIYEVTAELLDAGDGLLTSWSSTEVTLPAGTTWFLVSHTFSAYGIGLRKVRMTLRGEDGSPDWGGQYGAAFDDAAVQFDETTLAVELGSFEALWTGEAVVLRWRTESERDNIGFRIERSHAGDAEDWIELASFETQPALQGQGNSRSCTEYCYTDRTALPGESYFYRLSDVGLYGEITIHPPVSVHCTAPADVRPTDFSLNQNVPNPFNAGTRIEYSLPQAGPVRLEIFNLMGQRVTSLIDETVPAGKHTVRWEGRDAHGQPVGSGVYFYRLQTERHTSMRKMVLMR